MYAANLSAIVCFPYLQFFYNSQVGDNGSSSSESSLGSSSGYGSQSTVRIEEQQLQQQQQQLQNFHHQQHHHQQQHQHHSSSVAMNDGKLFDYPLLKVFLILIFVYFNLCIVRAARILPFCGWIVNSQSKLTSVSFTTQFKIWFLLLFQLLGNKGNLMAKYVPFLSPIRLLANLHKGISHLKISSRF